MRRAFGIAPIATAACVAAIVVTVGAVAPHVLSAQHTRQAHSPHAAQAGAQSTHAAQPHLPAIPGLPEFVVVSTDTGLEIVQTATGHVTGQVSTPAGQEFAYIAGDGSDRTFYVAAEVGLPDCQTYFYRFSLSAGGQPSALTRLPVSSQASLPTALSVSADGSKLAFSITPCGDSGATTIPPGQTTGYIGMLDTASGTITRQWTFTLGEDYPTSMSLTADGTVLAFAQLLPGGSAPVVKKLSTDAPSGTIDQASTVVGLSGVSSLSVGAALYACISTDLPNGDVSNQLGAYDLATGHGSAVLHTWTAGCSLAPNPVHGNVLVDIEAMEAHGPGPFVPVVDVMVAAVDVSTGRLTTLLKTSVEYTGSITWTLIGW